ncbi:hypothetical protein OVS_04405 [Mycoplasma ovis str. Michigan]|uniref:Uncharacterized protein n=1 Tax=Mycoplasma ovis str. Michigan TaxID=1415773 RepID=A0ABM5P2C2_9MOLU|nr:hypothetical protein [Mycoplasma ovis]AHC40608.1 hypothetical protein OVS_04405 [Mycoplasma ovis str. Michigan]
MFTWKDNLKEGQKVEVKMRVEKQKTDTEGYKIFFTGKDFQESEIVGDWIGEETLAGNDKFKAIKIEQPKVDLGQEYIYISDK